jgi:SAM-dependent methyltransferase
MSLDNEGYGAAQDKPDLYSQGLMALTSFSNEKEVTAQYIRGRGLGESVLDIGAGNGRIAQLLDASLNDRYVAIEQNPVLHAQLIELGITAIEGTYPEVSVTGHFDTVFSSHSMPVRRDDYAPFIDAAYDRVKPGGHLTVVTFSDLPSPYASIMGRVGMPRDTSGFHVRTVGEYLQTKGDLHGQLLESEVRAKSLFDIMAAIAFIGSTNGNPKKTQLIMDGLHDTPDILEAFRDENGYAFPLHSQAYTVRK